MRKSFFALLVTAVLAGMALMFVCLTFNDFFPEKVPHEVSNHEVLSDVLSDNTSSNEIDTFSFSENTFESTTDENGMSSTSSTDTTLPENTPVSETK